MGIKDLESLKELNRIRDKIIESIDQILSERKRSRDELRKRIGK